MSGFFKNTAHDLIDIYIKIRPSHPQRIASRTFILGAALLLISFNEVLYVYFFKPLGFSQDGYLAPILGFLLVVVAATVSLANTFAKRMPSHTWRQDRQLIQKIEEILPWQHVDDTLNNIHNHWHSREEIKPFFRLREKLKDPSWKFEQQTMSGLLENFAANLDVTLAFISKNFAPSDFDLDTYKFLEHISVDATGQHNGKFTQTAQGLGTQLGSFEQAYKDLFDGGRKLGLLLLE